MSKADGFLADILVVVHYKLISMGLLGLPCVTGHDDVTGTAVQKELISGMFCESGVDMMSRAASLMRALAGDLHEIACEIEAEIEPGFKPIAEQWAGGELRLHTLVRQKVERRDRDAGQGG